VNTVRVGLVAMGSHQGARTARSIAASWPVTVVADDRSTIDALAGLEVATAASLRDLASASDVVVFREIADDEDVEGLIRELGLAMAPDGVVVNTRPWGQPATLRRWADIGRGVGVAVVDAMTSGPIALDDAVDARSWTALMAGGERDAFERCRPILESVATTVSFVGGPGSGELAKLLNTLVFNANVMIVAEMLAVGDRLGFDRRGLVELISASSGASWALDNLAGGGMHRWGELDDNLHMFRVRLEAISAEMRERGVLASPLEGWARDGIAALPAALDRLRDLTHT
jgi:3-hydroxyisobutyrate dehydrogenase